VASLRAKLQHAQKNAPLERQAQILGNATVQQKRQANPNMDKDVLKKVKSDALTEARKRTGAYKNLIPITQAEWDAIQAGAVSPSMLTDILKNTDPKVYRELSTPKSHLLMTSTKTSRAKAMLMNGYTQAEVAEQLGVSLTTLKTALKKG
jgi:DNA-binding NarL/FixJ family response regulator